MIDTDADWICPDSLKSRAKLPACVISYIRFVKALAFCHATSSSNRCTPAIEGILSAHSTQHSALPIGRRAEDGFVAFGGQEAFALDGGHAAGAGGGDGLAVFVVQDVAAGVDAVDV